MSERGLSHYQQSGALGVEDPQVWSSGAFADFLNISRRFFPMPKERREVLGSVIESDWNEVSLEYLKQIVTDAHEFSKESLKRIGLTPQTYIEAIAAMVTNNTHTLNRLIDASEQLMGRKKSRKEHAEASIQTEYDSELMKKHQIIIDEYLSEVEPTEQPHIIVIVGPPGCGKTEVFKQDPDCQKGKAVNIDIDEIRKKLRPDFNPKDQSEVEAFREEAWRFADNLMAQCIASKRSIVMQTPLHRRKTWLKNPLLHEAIDHKQYDVRVKVIMRDVHDSFRRAMLRGMPMDEQSDVEGRMVALGDFIEAVKGYEVVESFVREYKASLELHDYLKYSEGKTHMHSKMGAKAFRRLQWLARWSWTVRAQVIEQSADVPIEKSRKVKKR